MPKENWAKRLLKVQETVFQSQSVWTDLETQGTGRLNYIIDLLPAYLNVNRNILRLLDGWTNFPFTTVKPSVIISNKLVYKTCFTSCRMT